jgi:hypothetical protein
MNSWANNGISSQSRVLSIISRDSLYMFVPLSCVLRAQFCKIEHQDIADVNPRSCTIAVVNKYQLTWLDCPQRKRYKQGKFATSSADKFEYWQRLYFVWVRKRRQILQKFRFVIALSSHIYICCTVWNDWKNMTQLKKIK